MQICPEELGRLLDRYWGTLVAWVGREHPFAEDVVQTAFIKLAAQSPPPLHISAWLFQVTRRLALNELKANHRRRQREQAASVRRPSAVDGLATYDSATDGPLDLPAVLDRLSDVERQIVVARIWGGLTFAQIAAAVESPKAKVWRMYRAAIEQLRTQIEQEALP